MNDRVLTAGLNNPPLILKNTQALTIRLKPKQSEMYNNVAGLSPGQYVTIKCTSALV
jgi:hypothetical protein